jgi:hypothetical protein
MEKLKRNTLSSTLFLLLSLALLWLSQRFLFEPYRDATLWKTALCYTASGLCFIALSFWVALRLANKQPGMTFALGTAMGLAATGIFIGTGAIFASFSPRVFAYGVSTAILDSIVFAAIAFAFGKTHARSGAKTLSVLAAAVLILAIGFLSSFSQAAIKSAPKGGVISNFQIKNCLPDGGGKPVKVILLAGQSNASGVSSVEYLSKKEDPASFARYNAGYENIRINFFTENGNNSSDGYYIPVTLGQGCRTSCFGPEIGLADALFEDYPQETFIILKYTWGGTNLYNQWLSPSSEGKTGGLYTAFVRFVKANMEYLLARNYNADIVAMCWMQGESDALDKNSFVYGENTANLVRDLRNEFADFLPERGMLFADAGISDSVCWKNYAAINDAKRAFAETSPLNIYLDTIAAGLTVSNEPEGNPDLAHYDSMSEILLGRMFGEAIGEFLSD